MTEEFSEVLKIITFLQMIHGSLKEGWLKINVEAKISVCGLATFSRKSLHLGVYS